MTLDKFIEWLGKEHGTAAHTTLKIIAARRDDEPNDVEWLRKNVRYLVERSHPGRTSNTLQTYRSRTLGFVERFMREQGQPLDFNSRRYDYSSTRTLPVPRPLTFDEQMSEAIACCARWPGIRKHLLTALVEAMTEHAKAEREKRKETT